MEQTLIFLVGHVRFTPRIRLQVGPHSGTVSHYVFVSGCERHLLEQRRRNMRTVCVCMAWLLRVILFVQQFKVCVPPGLGTHVHTLDLDSYLLYINSMLAAATYPHLVMDR